MSRTNSPIGRIAAKLLSTYNTRIDNLFDTKLSSRYCFARFKSELSTDLLALVNAQCQAILIRDGIFALSNANHLSKNELNYLIESLAIDLNQKQVDCIDNLYIFIFYIYSYVYFVCCTISIINKIK